VGGELTFFRRNDELESDFVLDFKGGPIVVEVTASSDPASRKFNRLAQAGEMLRASRIVMIHTGIVDTTDAHATELSLARFLMKPLLLLGQQHE
jgi:hypothetical protein